MTYDHMLNDYITKNKHQLKRTIYMSLYNYVSPFSDRVYDFYSLDIELYLEDSKDINELSEDEDKSLECILYNFISNRYLEMVHRS
jgi:hypothetical protein